MGTFERASTGLQGLDTILDQLRIGDNVVWQVDSIDDYKHFVDHFVKQALRENRKVVYMRFGQHPPLLDAPGVKVYNLEPNEGFEAFSIQVHNIATVEGVGTYYVFDSLSDLLSAWATDLMIGNFFKVTCPYLFDLDTIAYFAVLRNRNSYQTIARIRETTQLLLDVYRREDRYYIHPLKVWNRYTPTMFLPHASVGDQFVPITSSVEISRLFSHFQRQGLGDTGRKLDYWDRVLMKAQELLDTIEIGDSVSEAELHETVETLCKMMIGRDERVLALARKNFTLRDLLQIRNREIGTGFIGGKSVGMLMARNILRNDPYGNWRNIMEPHDSFYIGSDVYYTYLVENGCWNLLLQQKSQEGYFTAAAELRERIQNGLLPETIRERFLEVMDYYGQAPIIVRSSSLLEDNFGNAFAGKYESIFCVNQGNPQERYRMLEEAVKTVYASTMSEDALAYRLQRGLASSDEQMALLVMRVSGSNRGKYFFPDMAGVAMSRNLYVWRDDMDPRSGMMRMVLGLGTRAVDRVDDDYPRIVPLDQPLLRPESAVHDIRRFSQHKVDVLDTEESQLNTVPLAVIGELNPLVDSWNLMAIEDHEGTKKMKELGFLDSRAWVLTFEDLLANTDLPATMRKMLWTLERAYEYPVDIEFTVNFGSKNAMEVNLLQCRPLQTGRRAVKPGKVPVMDEGGLLFKSKGNFMGGSLLQKISWILYVDTEEYGKLSVADKYQIARLVGRLNRQFDKEAEPVMMIGPGRWGTSSPSLGVPVRFAEICNASVLVEVAGQKEGYMPELSFGTHFFQDLVETQIFYIALFPGKQEVVFNLDLLNHLPNRFAEIMPEYAKWQSVIKVVGYSDDKSALWLDADVTERNVKCYLSSVQSIEKQ
ncbi:MAG: PEP/pyruvate-binding domain-containing protein [Acidobacteriota bacterium]